MKIAFPLVVSQAPFDPFSVSARISLSTRPTLTWRHQSSLKAEGNEWTSDFDGFVGDTDDDSFQFAKFFENRASKDFSGTQSRQFSLGRDFVLVSYVGKMGFDEVTDWEYYYQNEDDPTDRKVVQPNIFDKSQPKRTRRSSGSVVRGTKRLIAALH